MSSINTVTGRGGSVSLNGSSILRIKNWSASETRRGGSEWGDSDANGGTNRSAGADDCTFTCEGVYDTTGSIIAQLEVNEVYAVVLSSVGGPGYTFARALCTDFSLNVNADTEEVIGWNASFGVDGTYTRS